MVKHPSREEADLAARRERARQNRHLFLNSEPDWAKSRFSEEDRALLEGDTPEQRQADFNTVDRWRDWKDEQRREESGRAGG